MVTCTACGRENPPGARFCNACGAPLAAPSEPRREERKVVTVLFADLVGFTPRAERLDPEDVRALLDPYWQHLRSELERFGGTVEKFIGDAVMALFGAPVAHEDDPERAVRAALAIRDWARNEGDLQVRIAVTTGEALVLLGARPAEGEGMAAGDVVNTAARLQAAAPVNGVLVGEATYRATANVIEYADAEPVVAKGKERPLRVWEALGARSRATIEAVSSGALVGRAGELDLLVGALQRMRRERQPQLVTVAGVPGIGKSRLVAELYAIIDAEEEITVWRRGRCLPYGDGISLWALGEIVKAELGVLESDSRDETRAKLVRALGDLVEDEGERERLAGRLAPLAGLEAEPGDRSESFAAWRRFVEALADRRPTVLVFEDLQWADDELLDFVDTLVERLTGVPLLVVCTTRPELFERRSGWGGGKRNALTISLAPLSADDTARIVARSLNRTLLDARTQRDVLARAEGNPLYAEQFARMLVEGADLDELPETVQGIVAARLDLLPADEKELLQAAAVVGRTFWPGALGADDDRLHALERKEFVRRERRSAVAGESEYSFSHALVRDVAYAQIPRGARADRHLRAADWIETLPADRAEDRAEMLAYHYAAALELSLAAGRDTAGVAAAARRAFGEAGDRAQSLNRFTAAHRFYSDALELADEPDSERARLLLERNMVGRQLAYGDPVADAREAAAILSAAGDTEGTARAELALATSYWIDGDGDAAARHGDRALELVASFGATPLKAEVLVERARLLMLAGDDVRARAMATEGLELSERLGLERFQAAVLATRGAAAGSRDDLQRAIAIAERASFVNELLRGLNNLGEHVLHGGDLAATQEIFGRMRAVCEEFGVLAQLRWLDGQELAVGFDSGDWSRALELGRGLIEDAEAGRRHYLAAGAYIVRAAIRQARDEGGYHEDAELALAHARRAADPQQLCPCLAFEAWIAARDGRTADARAYFDEAFEIGVRTTGSTYAWMPMFVCAAGELAEHDRYRRLLAGERPGPWVDAALATCDGDFAGAAERYRAMGALNVEAEARLFAARGSAAAAAQQLTLALDYFRSVGATARVRAAESVLAATA